MLIASLFALSFTACTAGAKEAKKLRDACNSNDMKACVNYAGRLERGDHVLRDPDGAIVAYDRACKAHLGEACTKLGQMYLQGDKREDTERAPELTRAAQYFRTACEVGGMDGCMYLGRLAMLGRLAPRDTASAQKLFDKACKGGSLDGCAQLATLLADSTRPQEKQDVALAADLMKKTCDAKVVAGCVGLGRLHVSGQGVEKNAQLASQLFKNACTTNRDAAGCAELGKMLENGVGMPQDMNQAAQMFRTACIRQYGEACASLADMFAKGAGTYRDPEHAQELINQACQLGFVQACGRKIPGAPLDSAAVKARADSIAKAKADSIAKAGGGDHQ